MSAQGDGARPTGRDQHGNRSPGRHSPADHPTTSATAPARPGARAAYAINAGLAWLGIAMVLVLSATDAFERATPTGHTYGDNSGAFGRVMDSASYFTVWSNVVVAVCLTLLAIAPTRDTFLRRVLRLDSVLMITITAIVYAAILAPNDHVAGWSRITNPLQHIVVPVVTVLVWLAWGPRRWVTPRVLAWSLAIPAAWIVWMLVRGALVGAYPYGFSDVRTHGYGSVALTLLAVLAFGIVVALIFWALDRGLSRRR